EPRRGDLLVCAAVAADVPADAVAVAPRRRLLADRAGRLRADHPALSGDDLAGPAHRAEALGGSVPLRLGLGRDRLGLGLMLDGHWAEVFGMARRLDS